MLDIFSEIDNLTPQENEDGSVKLVAPLDEEEKVTNYRHDQNLVSFLTEEELQKLSQEITENIERDKQSRQTWDDTITESLSLLGWDRKNDYEGIAVTNISKVVHPLLSQVILGNKNKLFKNLFPLEGLVKAKILGAATPDRMLQANRIEKYYNYLFRYRIPSYYEETDRLLMNTVFEGSAFRKWFFDYEKKCLDFNVVMAGDLILPNGFASTLEASPRITQTIRMTGNEVLKHQISGYFCPSVDLTVPYQVSTSSFEQEVKNIEGRDTVSQEEYFELYECHTELDLPRFEEVDEEGSQTGIKLPYVVILEKESGKILRIGRNWEQNDPSKSRNEMYVHFKFQQGLGLFGLGCAHIFGNNAKVATETLRAVIIAAAFNNFPAGYKSKSLKMAGGESPLRPGEFRNIDLPPSQNIHDAIMTLPYKGADPALIQIHQYIVETANHFADETGDFTKNASNYGPVGTTTLLLEEANEFYSAIHQSIHFSLEKEIKIVSKLLKKHKENAYPYDIGMNLQGEEYTPEIYKSDFDHSINVIPTCDSTFVTKTQRVALAREQLAAANQAPEIHNKREAYVRYYAALGVEDIALLLPHPKKEELPPPRDPVGEVMALLKGEPVKAYEFQESHSHLQVLYNAMADPLYFGNPDIRQAIEPKIRALIAEHLAFSYKKAIQIQIGSMIPDLGNPESPISGNPEMENRIAVMVAKASQELLQADRQISQNNAGINPQQIAQQEIELEYIDVEQREKEMNSREKLKIEDMRLQKEVKEAEIQMQKEQLKGAMLRDAHKLKIDMAKIEVAKDKNKILENKTIN